MKNKKAKHPKKQSDHDKLFKSTFNIREIALIYLKNFLGQDISSYFDWETLKQAPDSFVDDEFNEQFSDIVYNIQLNNKSAIKVSFLFEHKSSLPQTPVYIQLLKYLLRLWEQDISQNRKLTFIIPIVVYHGKAKWEQKPFSAAFKGIPDEFLRYLPLFEYQLTDVKSLPTEIIVANVALGALRSVLLEFKFAFDEQMLKQNFENIIIFAEGFQNAEVETMFSLRIFEYFQRRTSLGDKEVITLLNKLPEQKKEIMKSTYDNLIEKGIKIGKEQGIEQGIEIAQEKSKRLFTINLLRSTEFSDEKIADLVQATPAYVAAIRAEISPIH